MSLQTVKNQFRQSIQHVGLSIEKNALNSAAQYIIEGNVQERKKWLITELLKGGQPNVTEEIVKAITSGTSKQGIAAGQQPALIEVVDAFSIPQYYFNQTTLKFCLDSGNNKIIGDAVGKLHMYQRRLAMIKQRLMRNKTFNDTDMFNIRKDGSSKLSSIKALQGRVGQKTYVVGQFSELAQGKLYLEDADDAVPVDVNDAKNSSGFITETCIVMAEGVLRVDGVFYVQALGLPPVELREDSLRAFQGLNTFGTKDLSPDQITWLEQQEEAADNAVVVAIADVYLDQQETLQRLQTLFEGFSMLGSSRVALFIIMGNFLSPPSERGVSGIVQDAALLHEGFKSFIKILRQYETLMSSSTFVFVPGPRDPVLGDVLPRQPLPEDTVHLLTKSIPNCHVTTNPSRLRYMTQEVVLFRYDLQSAMQQAGVFVPCVNDVASPHLELYRHAMFTLQTQGHLCPVPLNQQPVYWSMDHANGIYPLPHVLLCADTLEGCTTNIAGVVCINPGQFSNGTMAVYYPSTKSADICDLEIDTENIDQNIMVQ